MPIQSKKIPNFLCSNYERFELDKLTNAECIRKFVYVIFIEVKIQRCIQGKRESLRKPLFIFCKSIKVTNSKFDEFW